MTKREKLAIVRRWYPNAMTTIDTFNQLIDYVEDVLDLEPTHIMMADSICSDDVNSIQFPVRAGEFLGPFKMGGLDGYPFAGLTGMGAFASHVPDDGAVFIYYGPHIGISKNGALGEIHRHGQSNSSGCCGAAKAGLKKLQDGHIRKGEITELDYQMNTIEQILLGEQKRIIQSGEPLLTATEVMYEAINRRINELIVQTKYNCHYVILMGAILINSDSDMGSFSALRRFEVLDLSTGKSQDLTAVFSG